MSLEEKRIRILLTKSVLDSHDRGVRNVAIELRDAGMEVIYSRYGMPEEIVKTALEEDVDVVGISFSTRGHMIAISEVTKLMREKKMDNVGIILGGVIPDKDIPAILKMGVGKIFGPGSSPKEIISYLKGGEIGKSGKS